MWIQILIFMAQITAVSTLAYVAFFIAVPAIVEGLKKVAKP